MGNTIKTIGLPYFRQLVVPIPSRSEQDKIAEALNDADELIESLEEILAKKRQTKQGATQALLSGRRRLSKFSAEWRMTRLGAVADFSKGKGLPRSSLNPFGSKRCIHYGELFTRYRETIDEIISRTDETRGCVISAANDVLMPTSDVTPRGLAKASCVKVDGILGGDILIIRGDAHRIDGSFLSYIIRYEE